MGRLAGFSADEVIRKLRQAGFIFDRQAKGSKYGGILKPALVLQYLTTPAIYLKERHELFYARLD